LDRDSALASLLSFLNDSCEDPIVPVLDGADVPTQKVQFRNSTEEVLSSVDVVIEDTNKIQSKSFTAPDTKEKKVIPSLNLKRPALPLSSVEDGVSRDFLNYSINDEEFKRNEVIKRVTGVGSCLYRSLLHSIGLSEDMVPNLRDAIAKWFEDGWCIVRRTTGLSRPDIIALSIETRDPGSWRGELQIFSFEQMSRLKNVVYEEIIGSNGLPEYYVCRRGLDADISPEFSGIIYLLWSGRSSSNDISNHYDAIERGFDLFSAASTFEKKYLPKDLVGSQ